MLASEYNSKKQEAVVREGGRVSQGEGEWGWRGDGIGIPTAHECRNSFSTVPSDFRVCSEETAAGPQRATGFLSTRRARPTPTATTTSKADNDNAGRGQGWEGPGATCVDPICASHIMQ